LGKGENLAFILEKGGEIRKSKRVAQKIKAKWEERGQGDKKKCKNKD
jgi:16S rRNA C1402 N4-methylase RsmH